MVRKKATPRRRVTPKRKSPAKKRKKTASRKLAPASQLAARQLEVYHNPFSNATAQPKIPDGKVGESLGQTFVKVEEVGGTGTQNGIFHMLMFPGLQAGLIATQTTTAEAAFPSTGYKFQIFNYSDGNMINFSSHNQANFGVGKVNLIENYDSWRVVSQGLKLKLLNPAEENDGWFEACRVSYRNQTDDFYLQTNTAVGNKNNSGVVHPARVLESMKSQDIAQENSYVTDTLRNIEHHQFNLNPMRNEHDWIKPLHELDFKTGQTVLHVDTDKVTVFQDGIPEVQQFIDSNIDRSYDMIYIRVHGRNAAPSFSRLHAQLTSNHEVIYSVEERDSRYHNRTVIAKNLEEHASAKRGTNKASVVPFG
ncbi:MAG: capsid protein [Avonheates virus SG_146]|uniref:capsid protein n=1 Tax=Avonheates virus SG_146 TaxID=2914481 RepID=UPI0024819D82|nr:MAG: capsid protein [Avonheates virus SG_146]UNI72628.1 MAG: capsid protein [Avonheates virus SG_146]